MFEYLLLLLLFILQWVLKTFTTGEFIPSYELIRILGKYVCSADMELVDGVCENIIFLICGFDQNNINIVSPSSPLPVLPCLASSSITIASLRKDCMQYVTLRLKDTVMSIYLRDVYI